MVLTNENNTVTFTDKDGLFEFTVKKEFLEKCPNPSEHDLEALTVTFSHQKFLHNPAGSAVNYLEKLPKEVKEKLNSIDETSGLKAYWLDGTLLKGEERKKFIHDTQFHTTFHESLKKAASEE